MKEPVDVRGLIVLKEEIKNRVMDPELSWEERMELYKKVQQLNEKITKLLGN
jgi:hypothetical protein